MNIYKILLVAFENNVLHTFYQWQNIKLLTYNYIPLIKKRKKNLLISFVQVFGVYQMLGKSSRVTHDF